MYIKHRRYVTKDGEVRRACSLVETHSVDGKVTQQTLLDLGREFSLSREAWSHVVKLVKECLDGQSSIELETHSTPESHVARQIIRRLHAKGYRAAKIDDSFKAIEIQRIDYPPNAHRTVGGERLAIRALDLLELDGALQSVRLAPPAIRIVKVCILASMLKPRGRPIMQWLSRDSAVLELLDMESQPLTEAKLRSVPRKLWPRRSKLLSALQGTHGGPDGTTLSSQCRDYTFSKAKPHSNEAASVDQAIMLILDGQGAVQGCRLVRNPAKHLREASRIKATGDILVVRADQVTDLQLFRWSRRGIRWLCINVDDSRLCESTSAIQWDLAHFTTELRLYRHCQDSSDRPSGDLQLRCQEFEAAMAELRDRLVATDHPARIPTAQRQLAELQSHFEDVSGLYDIHLSRGPSSRVVGLDYKQVSKLPASTPTFRYALRTNLMDCDRDQLVQITQQLMENRRILQCLNDGVSPEFDGRMRSTDAKKERWLVMLLACLAVRKIERTLLGRGIEVEWDTLRDSLQDWNRITAIITGSDSTVCLQRQDTQVGLDIHRIAAAMGVQPARHLERCAYQLKL